MVEPLFAITEDQSSILCSCTNLLHILLNNYMNSFDILYNYLINSNTILEAISDVGDKYAEVKGSSTETAFAKILTNKFGRGVYLLNPKPGEREKEYQNFLNGNADWFQATLQQEKIDHFDFGIREGNNIITFEVKGNKDKIIQMALSKTLRMKNVDPSKGIFVELKGVTGFPGWVYGKADWIAFQNADGNSFTAWTLQPIRKLIEKKNLENAPRVERMEDAVYSRYQRPGKRDFVTIISADEVKSLGGRKTIFK